jgi:hypothetical protein
MSQSSLIVWKRAFLFGVVIFFLTAGANAQTTNATIIGDVRDTSDAAVVGATVTVKNTATGFIRSVQTDAAGSYRVYPLNPGTYSVSVASPGFRTAVQPQVVVNVAANVKVDLTLQVGEISQSVEVSSAATVLQTQDATVGGLVTGTEVARLPVNGRNYTRLILLLPGTSDQGLSQGLGQFSGTQLISVNGQRRQDNNYTIDGTDNNWMAQKSPGSSPPMDSIAEFRVMNNGSAEFGTASGANVNVATKSGTRDLHGSVYEYFRNDKLNANDFFANKQNQGVVPFKQNQYGISGGGPVILPHYNGREKTFWFANWEGLRRVRGSTLLSTVPTEPMRTGDFSAWPKQIYDPFSGTLNANGTVNRTPFTGNIIPPSMLNTASLLYLKLMVPLPSQSGLANNLLNTDKVRDERDAYVVRVDHSFNPNNTIFVRWSSQKVYDAAPNMNPVLQPFQRWDAYNMAAGYVHVFGTTTVLELKFGFNNPRFPNGAINPAIPNRAAFLQQAGIQMLQPTLLAQPIPIMNATGEFALTGGGTSDSIEDSDYQYTGNLSKMLGRHSLKMGADLIHRSNIRAQAGPSQGTFDFDTTKTNLYSNPSNTGSATASYMLGVMSDVRRGLGLVSATGLQNVPTAFLQDDWRVNSKLTVNLGVRWEYSQPMYAKDNNIGSIWVQPNFQTGVWKATPIWAGKNPITGAGPNQQGFGRGLQRSEFLDFAPRVGMAYQLNQKTVFRAGFGLFFNSSFAQEFGDRLKMTPYILQELFTTNTGTVPDLTLTSPGPPFGNSIGGWPQDPNKRTPYSEQWNAAIQRQLMGDLSLEIGYVGNANHHQIGYTQINQAFYPAPTPIATRRPLPTYGDMDGGFNIFNSNYEAGHISLVKRFSKGLQVQANYTYGKSLADQSSLAEEKTQNAYNRRLDWGPSSIDLRHIFQFAWVYELPFGKGRQFGSGWNGVTNAILGGWTLDGITRIQTGSPLNVTLSGDLLNIGSPVTARPNLACDPNGLNNRNTSAAFFKTSCFVAPAPYTYGNAGQNVVRADGRQNIDFSFMKNFRFHERHEIEFRGEFFNILNHVNMGQNQSEYAGSGSGYNTTFGSSSFGKPTSATFARQVQLVLRYTF